MADNPTFLTVPAAPVDTYNTEALGDVFDMLRDATLNDMRLPGSAISRTPAPSPQIPASIQKKLERRERFQPARLWRIAHHACEGGWNVYITRRPGSDGTPGQGWALAMSETNHCVHVEFVPNTDPRFPDRDWRLINRELRTRCPHGETVGISELLPWLETHPDECAGRPQTRPERRPPIAEMVDFLPASCARLHPHPGAWVPGYRENGDGHGG